MSRHTPVPIFGPSRSHPDVAAMTEQIGRMYFTKDGFREGLFLMQGFCFSVRQLGFASR